MKKTLWFVVVLSLLGTSCSREKPLFARLDPTRTGVTFSNQLSNTPELNILSYLYYYNGGGIAAGDFNNDGWTDLYFTGNQTADRLYLNRGNWTFEDVTGRSGIANSTGWTTGVTHVDINNDGLLDIYVCKVGGYRSLTGQNLLFVNQGINAEGYPEFKESASTFGLDFSGLSTHAAFFDYDRDGDLDMYLLNHSVHPNRTYGRGNQRQTADPISGDILFENQNGQYVDISSQAGIFQGKSGYGLGLSIGDVNSDGYPDMYVGNDFFENDYLYINQQNGTFQETITSDPTKLGHTTHFSMGNAIADLNNDGRMDILSLDMLPENLETYKSSGLEYAYPIYRQYLNQGYAPQFMQNSLHVNLDGERFSEIANLSGIAATEWSWGGLVADFDNDGRKDVFISNGIKGATNDMDYMNFIANDKIQRRIDSGMKASDLPLINEIPEKKVPNYMFRNNGDLTFENMSGVWLKNIPSYSNGCVYADLDNDGDLDIAINNINEPATLLENTTTQGNFIKLKLNGPAKNKYGLGAKISIYLKDKQIVHEHFPTQGYLSTLPNTITLGLGKNSTIDSLQVVWPGGQRQLLQQLPGNSTITLDIKLARTNSKVPATPNTLFSQKTWDTLYVHSENVSVDFDREPLIPFAYSNQGPCLAVADINKDGLDDFFIGGAKRQAGKLFIQQQSGQFLSQQDSVFVADAIREDTASEFFDANGDGWPDLLVAGGGNEFTSGLPLRPRLYLNENGTLTQDSGAFEGIFLNASDIAIGDYDNDGDQDVVLVANTEAGAFGKTPRQFLLQNNGQGAFKNVTATIAPQLEQLGNIQSVTWVDFNADGNLDLAATGHWIAPHIFINDGEKLQIQPANGLEDSSGWWNAIVFEDFDNDGDLDFVGGNWGLNTKLTASAEAPLTLYRHDFDANGQIDPVITYHYNGAETPFASKDELVKQLPFLNKEYLSYSKFAQASLSDLFGDEALKNAEQKHIVELQSCYFRNEGNGSFTKHPLPVMAQASQVNAIAVLDVNQDGYKDLLLAGNNYTISTQLGRQDAFHGLVLLNDTTGNFSWAPEYTPNISGVTTAIKTIKIQGQEHFLFGRNDTSPALLTKTEL